MPRNCVKDDTHREYKSQLEASSFILPRLREHFDVYEEVRSVGPPDDTCYRYDALTYCNLTDCLLAWEFKRSHLLKSEFAGHLRQAVYYHGSRISDERVPAQLRGRQPNACIVFPSWNGLHDDGTLRYECEARGMLLLASHFRVGFVAFPEKQDGFSIVIGERDSGAVWHSWQGWTGNAPGKLKEKRPLASQRKHDRG